MLVNRQYKLSGPNVEEYSRYLQETTIWNFNKSNNNTKTRLSELLQTMGGDLSEDIIEEFRNIQDLFTERI